MTIYQGILSGAAVEHDETLNGNGTGSSPLRVSLDNIISSLSSIFVPLSRKISINGTTQDLSANRAWTIEAGGDVTADNVTITGDGTELNPLKISDEYQRRINAGI